MTNQEIRLTVNSEGQFVLTYRGEPWYGPLEDRFTSAMTRNESHAMALRLFDAQGQGAEVASASILRHAGWICFPTLSEAGEKEASGFLRKRHWTCAPPGRDGTREVLEDFFHRIQDMKDEGGAYLRYEMARHGYALTRLVPEDAPSPALELK